jgi:hypothetical protein
MRWRGSDNALGVDVGVVVDAINPETEYLQKISAKSGEVAQLR